MGFLWFNCFPAKVFMGDTGSLALGGLIGYVSIVIRQELILFLVGGVFVMEAISVLTQVGYFKYTKRNIASQRVDIGDKPTIDHAVELATPLMDRFAKGDLDAVDIVFAKFNSAVSTPPTTLQILPVTAPEQRRSGGQATKAAVNYILKPSAEEILEQLLPLYVQNQVYRALVETAAAEHGARRTAMKNATDAGSDMLTILQRTFNRARQAQITQELAEIVGGAEALKG
jgi:F-type H+-transporting ATPase subunit gamma